MLYDLQSFHMVALGQCLEDTFSWIMNFLILCYCCTPGSPPVLFSLLMN